MAVVFLLDGNCAAAPPPTPPRRFNSVLVPFGCSLLPYLPVMPTVLEELERPCLYTGGGEVSAALEDSPSAAQVLWDPHFLVTGGRRRKELRRPASNSLQVLRGACQSWLAGLCCGGGRVSSAPLCPPVPAWFLAPDPPPPPRQWCNIASVRLSFVGFLSKNVVVVLSFFLSSSFVCVFH